MIVEMKNKSGIKLLTAGKIVKEDIAVIPKFPTYSECNKPHVIEVEVLPTENIDENAVYLCGGRYYKYTSATLENVYLNYGEWYEYKEVLIAFEIPEENISYNIIPTKTTEGILATEDNIACHLYYIEDENNLFVFQNGEWVSFDEFIGEPPITNGGVISDISEAVDEDKYYVVLSGGWKEWIPKEECGGGAELNIAYGDTPPDDTTKLWCKCSEPEAVQVIPPSLVGANTVATISGEGEITTLSAKLPKGAYGIATSTVGTKIYLFGGDSGSSLNTIQVYNTETETITTLDTKLPKGAYFIASSTVGTKIYLFGGYYGSGILDTINVFDAETETITTLSKKLSQTSYGIASSVVGTKIYLFGGFKEGIGVSTIKIFNTETQSITTLSAKLPKGVYRLTSSVVGTKIYLFGGSYNSSNNVDTICEFDTETLNITTLTTKLPTATRLLASATIDTNVYLFGGNSVDGILDTINVFDTSSGNINTLGTKLPMGAYGIATSTVGTKIYLFGGYGSGYIDTINVFEGAGPIYLTENHLLIVASVKKNLFALLPNVAIGVEGAYIGNENNEGEEIEKALYKDGTWANI